MLTDSRNSAHLICRAVHRHTCCISQHQSAPASKHANSPYVQADKLEVLSGRHIRHTSVTSGEPSSSDRIDCGAAGWAALKHAARSASFVCRNASLL